MEHRKASCMKKEKFGSCNFRTIIQKKDPENAW